MNLTPGSPLRLRFDELDGRLRALAPRERVLVAGMLLALVGFMFDQVALRPIETRREQVAIAMRSQTERIAALEGALESKRNPVIDVAERARRDELRQLERQIATIDEGIRNAIARLVPPEAAVEILEELLASDGRLTLVNLTSEAPRRLGPEETNGASTLYQHGLRLEIQGDFAATLDYLRRLEASPWQLLWDRLDYRVERHPEARVTIEIHTLSEREEWVGV